MNEDYTTEELRKNYQLMLHYRYNRRPQENIIEEIVDILRNRSKEMLIPYIMQMISMIGLRHTSDMFENLMSPMKQFAYVIDLYFTIDHSSDEGMPDENSWNRLKELLLEIEMTYFSEIGFFEEDEGNFEVDKISISMKSFFDFHSNL